MRADTQLDYAVFQLTPTRTRCELLVVAQGTVYKLASGLVKPFIDQLRAAEEQIAKGGYSIRLEPPDPGHTKWFTKGTMERFVRFVSTPEVLERVSTVDIELTELEETVRKQENESSDGNHVEDEEPLNMVLSPAGGKSALLTNIDRHSSKDCAEVADNGTQENTKQRLLRALDSRRGMLQKEQGMAFARAIAAGFSIEQMDDLVSFARTFGAVRFECACSKFIALCKKRQESGLWDEDLEMAAAEHPDAWHGKSDELRRASFPNDGKLCTGKDGSHNFTRRGSLDNQSAELCQQLAAGLISNGIVGEQGLGGVTPGLVNGHPVMVGWQGQPPAQYMQNIHPSLYASPGGIPYPPHIGNPYLQPPYAEGNNWQACSPVPPIYWQGKQNSMPSGLQTYNKEGFVDKAGEENNLSDDDQGEYLVDAKSKSEPRRKLHRRSVSPRRRSISPSRGFHVGRSGRSGMVVIRNINYISPNAQGQGNTEENDGNSTESHSEDDSNINESSQKNRDRNKLTSPRENSIDESLFLQRKRVISDAIQMQTNMEAWESENQPKKHAIQEHILPFSNREHKSMSNVLSDEMYSGEGQQKRKIVSAGDESFILLTKNRTSSHSPVVDGDIEFSNIESSSYRKSPSDDSFLLCGRGVTREEPDHDWRTHLDYQSEMSSKQDVNADETAVSNKADFCEPDELFIVPDRNKNASNRNPVEYDMQVLAADMMECRHNEQSTSNCGCDSGNIVSVDEPKESTTPSGKGRKTKEMLDKRKMTAINRPLRSSPLTEAQLRADKLRAYKADLQKMKKEKDEEERKRIEDLKRQRQARIAARTALNSSSSTKTIGPTAGKSLSTVPTSNKKLSNSSLKIYSSMNVAKVRDLTGSKSSRVSGLVSKTTDNALSRSVSSLSDIRKEKSKTTPLTRASTGSQQLSHLKKNLKDGSNSPASAAKSNIDEKKQSSPKTTSMVKGAALARVVKNTSLNSTVKSVTAMPKATSSVKTPTKQTSGDRLSSVKPTPNREKDDKASSIIKSVKNTTSQTKQQETNNITPDHKKVSTPKPNDTSRRVAKSDSSQEAALNLVEGGTVKDEACNNISSHVLEEESHRQRDLLEQITEEKETISKEGAPSTGANNCIEASEPEANKITVTDNIGRSDSGGYAHIRARLSSDVLGVTGAFDTMSFQDDARPTTLPLFNGGESHKSIPFGEGHEKMGHASSLNSGDAFHVSSANLRKGYHAPVARLSSIDWDSGNRRKSDSDEKDSEVANISATLANVVLSDRYFPASTSNQLQSPVTPSKNLPRLHEAIQQEAESDSKKKSSKTPPSSKDSKGLKRLLLLGRRSSRGSPGEQLVSSPGEVEEEGHGFSSSNGSIGIGSIVNAEQSRGKSDNSGSSSSKVSKSFFSLSTFRGKGEGKGDKGISS